MPRDPATRPAVYTPYTLAERWKVTPAAIRRMIREGRLPAFRVGKLYRIKAEVVDGIEGTSSAANRP